ncbi:PAS domain S-box protein [Nodosilinea sp. E11]|uniref:PAS domain S-box protein n=1 Tax=Nodosilinea sp. E11 TaxID=3037479 RepID=UPI002934F240|nr:PAS domain S-box protein [Nodosilinea sp. E11]WOD39012.1 PAS domain S-box protein [Nodosilinea sp. E11]
MAGISNRVASGPDVPTPTAIAPWHQAIAAIARQIRQSLDLTTILTNSVEAVQRLLDCDRALLYQFATDHSGQVVVEAVQNPQWSMAGQTVHDPWSEADRLPPDDEGQVWAIADVAAAHLTPCHAEFLAQFQVKASLIVPVLCETQLWGLLIAHSCTAPRPWLPEDVANLQQMAVQVGIALYQADLKAQLQAAKANLEAQTETMLRQSRDQRLQLAAIVETSQDAIISKTSDGLITSWNQAAERLFGYSAAEAIGQPITLIIPPDRQADAALLFQQLHQGKPIATYETQRQCKDGRLVEVALTMSPVQDETGAVVGASKIARDITAQRQAQRALQEQTAILRSFYDSSPLMMGVVELSVHDILHISDNQATAAFFNTTVEALEGQWASNLGVPPDYIQVWVTHYRQSQATGQPVQFDYAHTFGTSTFWLSVVVSFIGIAESKRPCFSYVATDITDRKQVELTLQRSEARYRNIIETTLEGVWMLDAQGKTTFINQQMADMLGYSIEDMASTALLDFIAPEDQAQAKTYLECRRQGIEEKHPFKFRRQDQTVLWALVSATPMLDENDTYAGCIGLLADVTPIITIQEALKTSKMQLSSVLNSSLDGIMAFCSVRDGQGTIVDFEWLLSNPTACDLVGRTEAYLVGKRLLDEMPGNLEEGLFDGYVHTVETGEPYRREFYYNHDGIESWFETVAVKLGDGFAVTFRNVTSLKQSEQTLYQVNQQLEARVADLDQRHNEMVILSEISDYLQACSTIEEACHTITNLVETLFPKCSGGIFITHASHNRLAIVNSWGRHLHSDTRFKPDQCWALRRGRTHHVGPDRHSLRCAHVPAEVEIEATLCIPMLAQGETLGLLHLSTETTEALSEPKQQLARALAEQLGMAIANLKLQETLKNQSIRDSLTGLYNRRYLEESFTREIGRAQRKQHSIGVIMLDIDHFKQFNDTFGHDIGDFVLQLVGTLLKENVRSSDIACRYGGEEMTLILPEADLAATIARAEVIRVAISQLRPHHQGQRLDSLTASFGVASFPQHGSTIQTLIKAADAALYRAKAAGRNQVLVAL